MAVTSSGFLPTRRSDSIALSALMLRESLAQVYQLYRKTKDMVLISHSMGGLLSPMQAVTNMRVLWDDVFKGDADRLYAKLPAESLQQKDQCANHARCAVEAG